MKVTIREPFSDAWKIFRWHTKCLGIGINQKIVDEQSGKNQTMQIDVLSTKQSYIGKPSEIKKFAVSNKWTYIVGRNTKLYVIPVDLLRKLI